MRHGGPITFFGKAVEIKSHLKLGAFDGYSDADINELVARLRTIPNPAVVADASRSGETRTVGADAMGETPGIQAGSNRPLPLGCITVPSLVEAAASVGKIFATY